MQDPVMVDRVKRILADLETVRENLLALSDDIWLTIDHNDQDALAEGFQFKRTYNEKMAAFDGVASDISNLIQQFTAVKVKGGADIDTRSEENQRIIRELDRETAHSLDEDLSYMRPYGFVLRQYAFKGLSTWRDLYRAFCQALARLDPVRFKALPDNPMFISRRNNRAFARDTKGFLRPVLIADGIYTESNMSANSFRDRMRQLLRVFGIAPSELRLYLREDRNAEQ